MDKVISVTAEADICINDGASVTRQGAAFASINSKVVLWCLLALFCSIWFYALASRTLVPTDEGRYAQIASEMAMTSDFVTPRLNGIKYFGKPPLQTWINAWTFKLLGFGEWQARLWTSLCGLIGIAVVFHTGRRVFNERTGFMAALVLGSSLYWTIAGHVNSYDMSLSAMMALALGALLIAQRKDATPREQCNWMLICWLGLALAVMSKGLVGIVLPGAVFVLYTLVSRDWHIWRRLHLGKGLLLFLIVTAPWFILVSIQNPEFPHFFFIREHFHRFTSNVHLREAPWYYFIPLAALGSMPWLGLLGQSLLHGARRSASGFQPERLLLVWVVFIFCFFSFSRAKLPSYILPIFPALALLVAHYLDSTSHNAIRFAAGLFGLMGAVALASAVIVPALPKTIHKLNLAYYYAYIPWLAAASLITMTGSGLAIFLVRRSKEMAVLLLAASGFLAGQLLVLGHDPVGRDKAGVAHLSAIQSELVPQTPIYAVGAYEYALPFYLRRTLILVGRAEDGMRLGLEKEPHLWIPKLDEFIKKWRDQHFAGSKALAIMRPDIYADFVKLGVPMRMIAQDHRRVIVANDMADKD